MSGMQRHRAGATRLMAVALAAFGLVSACERPPTDETQIGYRGTGMELVKNPRMEAALKAAQLGAIPDIYPPVEPIGETAGEVYENVQILGDLDVAEFDRLMFAITAWVAPPEQGCNYCHNPENLASDDVYTKVVSREMLKMTWEINNGWDIHVGETGVTCFTCHRGQPVPGQIWFENPGPKMAGGFAADRAGQNIAGAETVAFASLPYDPFSSFLASNDNPIRVQGQTALPPGGDKNIMDTEWTYGLMMHMSDSLGVNCSFCHNTRAFYDWTQSSPQRITAQHGIAMVQALNEAHLAPLTSVFPEARLGPLGDVAKVNCATCHQGVNKPLYGTSMLMDFPVLAAPPAKPLDQEAKAEVEAP